MIFKLRFHSLLKWLRIIKETPFSLRKQILNKLPEGRYCYVYNNVMDNISDKSQYNCPFMYYNKLSNWDCSLYEPKWKFWKWNGYRSKDFTLDDNCKMCSYKMNY